MRMQHDCYSEALRVICAECNRLALFAHYIASDGKDEAFRPVSSIDHRTLQEAHDLLAAAWRFRTCPSQGRLPLNGAEPRSHATRDVWLAWLADEVRSWLDRPHLVRHVIDICRAQNAPRGYAAEDELAFALKERFSDVLWTNSAIR